MRLSTIEQKLQNPRARASNFPMARTLRSVSNQSNERNAAVTASTLYSKLFQSESVENE